LQIELDGLKGSLVVEIFVTFTDKKKIIVVRELFANRPKEAPVDKGLIRINLSRVVISITQNSHVIDYPYESFVLLMDRILFIKVDTNKSTQYQLKLGFLQFDQS
jgi:hypothetical protein